jgi:hypothetical protein
MLTAGACLVEFNKADGSARSMPCTLKPGLMPPQKPGSGAGIVSEALLVVWCLDKQAWRSFRLDRVKSIRSLKQRS